MSFVKVGFAGCRRFPQNSWSLLSFVEFPGVSREFTESCCTAETTHHRILWHNGNHPKTQVRRWQFACPFRADSCDLLGSHSSLGVSLAFSPLPL